MIKPIIKTVGEIIDNYYLQIRGLNQNKVNKQLNIKYIEINSLLEWIDKNVTTSGTFISYRELKQVLTKEDKKQ